MTNRGRAMLSFDVSTAGNGSRFTFNNGDSTRPVKFVSTKITRVNVNGDFAVFDGGGTLNGTPRYTFTVSATDGGGAASGLDTVSIQLSGPNNFTHNAPATIAGGDIVVHP